MEETYKQMLEQLAEIERKAAQARVSDDEKAIEALRAIRNQASKIAMAAEKAIDEITAREVAGIIGMTYPKSGAGTVAQQ